MAIPGTEREGKQEMPITANKASVTQISSGDLRYSIGTVAIVTVLCTPDICLK